MKGSYILLLKLKNSTGMQIGNLRNLDFEKGIYVYVGSALNGLDQRIQRHLRKNKKMYWHIDYLVDKANIINVFYKPSETREECFIAKTLKKELSIIPDFGCSDCLCKSHLFYGSYKKIKNVVTNLGMKQYNINAKS